MQPVPYVKGDDFVMYIYELFIINIWLKNISISQSSIGTDKPAKNIHIT